jgi:hypothetical protein
VKNSGQAIVQSSNTESGHYSHKDSCMDSGMKCEFGNVLETETNYSERNAPNFLSMTYCDLLIFRPERGESQKRTCLSRSVKPWLLNATRWHHTFIEESDVARESFTESMAFGKLMKTARKKHFESAVLLLV